MGIKSATWAAAALLSASPALAQNATAPTAAVPATQLPAAVSGDPAPASDPALPAVVSGATGTAPTAAESAGAVPVAAGVVASPNPSSAAAASSAAAVAGKVLCLQGRALGSDEASAETVTGMVCDALRQNGVEVVAVAPDQEAVTEAYVVRLQKLGTSWVIRVSREKPLGVEVDSRQLLIKDLDETPVAADRIGRAFGKGQPVQETQDYTTVTQHEGRSYAKRSGEVVVGPGLSTVYIKGSDGGFASGLNFNLYYEYPKWGLGFGGYMAGHENTTLGGLFVGARHYVLDGDITPLVGAGASFGRITQGSFDGGGVSFYAEVGAEFFRLGKTHLAAYLRAEIPTYDMKDNGTLFDSTGSNPGETTYRVPIGLHLNLGF